MLRQSQVAAAFHDAGTDCSYQVGEFPVTAGSGSVACTFTMDLSGGGRHRAVSSSFGCGRAVAAVVASRSHGLRTRTR